MSGTIISTTGGDTTPTKGRKTPRKHEDIGGQGGAERGAARRGRGPAEAPHGLLERVIDAALGAGMLGPQRRNLLLKMADIPAVDWQGWTAKPSPLAQLGEDVYQMAMEPGMLHRWLLACETLAGPRPSARVFRDLAAEADGGTHEDEPARRVMTDKKPPKPDERDTEPSPVDETVPAPPVPRPEGPATAVHDAVLDAWRNTADSTIHRHVLGRPPMTTSHPETGRLCLRVTLSAEERGFLLFALRTARSAADKKAVQAEQKFGEIRGDSGILARQRLAHAVEGAVKEAIRQAANGGTHDD